MIRLVAGMVITVLIGVASSVLSDPWWVIWCLAGPLTCVYVAALALARHQGVKWGSW